MRLQEGLGLHSLEAAAEMAGYAPTANFAAAFRRAFDAAPSEVRRRYRTS
ncbi:hypothetical protein [Thalassobius sp. Cn5-15]|nr:hypothetical protein [Thalassobius sp. Cn5-15]MCG7494233.1 hypothetical protein [Thalassobius sp. Cn5-15]